MNQLLIRQIAPRDPHERHRTATTLELLTDLCFVVAVAQAATSLHHAVSEGHFASGLGHFLMVFFAVWWTWLNFTWFGSAYDNDDVPARLLTIVQILGALVVAAGVARFFDGDPLLVIIGYCVMRSALVLQWLRVARHDQPRRRTAQRYTTGLVLVQLCWVGFYFVPAGLVVPVFLALVLCELAVPVWAEWAEPTTWHPHHVAERYGLFFIIVLGETILSTTVAIQGAVDGSTEFREDLGVASVVVGGVLTVFSLWWLYFARDTGHALEKGDASPFLWGFGHYAIFAATAGIGAGLAARVDFWTHHSHAPELTTALAVTVPVTALLASLWFICVRVHDPGAHTWAAYGVTVAVVLAGSWTPVPELVTGLACVGLLTVELGLTRQRRAVT